VRGQVVVHAEAETETSVVVRGEAVGSSQRGWLAVLPAAGQTGGAGENVAEGATKPTAFLCSAPAERQRCGLPLV
jgi:hypothetical protein